MLEAGAVGDAFFETFVAGELVKNLSAHGKDPREYLYYYRDTDQREVDLVYTERDDSYNELFHPQATLELQLPISGKRA